MPYTRSGPFVDGGAPFLSAATFNNLEGGIISAAPTYTIDASTAGIDWTGATDSAATINSILGSAPQGTYGNVNVNVPAGGKLRIDSMITIDLTRAGLNVTYGALTLDASHISTTNGVGVQITASAAVPNNAGYGGPKIGPFRLIGPGRSNAGTTGILWTATTASGGMVRNVTLDHVSVEEFGVLETYGDNTFCVGHDGCVFKGGGTYGTWMPSTTTNSGERLVYENCTWQECAGPAIQNDGGEITVIGGSIDYDTGVMVANTGGGVTEFYGTHFEKSIVDTDYWFTLTGGVLKVIGGKLVGTGTYASGTAPAYIVYNTASPTYADGTVIFDAVTFGNSLRTSSGFFAGGGGTTILQHHTRPNQFQSAFICSAAENTLLARGSFEGSTFADTWILASDTAAITAASRTTTGVTGANGTAATAQDIAHTGTWALKLTKTGAVGTALEFEVLVPIRRKSVAGVIGYAARNATVTGSFNVKVVYCTVTTDGGGVIRSGNDQQVSSNAYDLTTDIAASGTWYQFTSPTQVQRAPSWATHVAVRFNLLSMGPGSVYLDDLCITDS